MARRAMLSRSLQRYAGSGCNRVTVRLATMGDAMAQLRRLTEEVLPFLDSDPTPGVS